MVDSTFSAWDLEASPESLFGMIKWEVEHELERTLGEWCEQKTPQSKFYLQQNPLCMASSQVFPFFSRLEFGNGQVRCLLNRIAPY